MKSNAFLFALRKRKFSFVRSIVKASVNQLNSFDHNAAAGGRVGASRIAVQV